MNNTKWREVLTLIVEHEIWFQIQLIDWENHKFSKLLKRYHSSVFSQNAKGFVDIYGSGFFLRELRKVRCPAVVPGRLMLSSRNHHQDIKGLGDAMTALGRVPMEMTDNFLEIRGYDEISERATPTARLR